MNRPLRCALVNLSLGPYHIALYNAFAQRDGVALDVLELSSNEPIRAWNTRQVDTQFGRHTLSHTPYRQNNGRLIWRVVQELRRRNPDVLYVTGYRLPEMRAATLWGRARNKRVITISDTLAIDRARRRATEQAKRLWLRLYDGAIVPGRLAADYLKSLGMPEGKLFPGGMYAVDNDYFAAQAAAARALAAERRAAHGLPARYFVYVGRFAPEKNLALLIRAFQDALRAAPPGEEWSLALVGSGPQQAALAQLAARTPERVRLLPFQQIDTLPTFYALADAFVLPSLVEPWGLVVNEAMACGLPVLVSTHAGSHADLVEPGVNGFVFDPRDEQGLSRLLARCMAESAGLPALGTRAQERIGRFSLARAAEIMHCAALGAP